MTDQKTAEAVKNGRYQKILVATDFSTCSEAAVQQGLWLAKRAKAKLVLAHSLPDLRQLVATLPLEARRDFFYGEGDLFDKEVRRESDAKLAELVKTLDTSDVEVSCETLLGTPYVELTYAVQKEGYDVVLAGTRGVSTWTHLFVGSTTQRLVTNCPCSVWVVKEQHRQIPAKVLATTDFSEGSLKAVREALRISQMAGAEFHLLHVIEELDEELIKRSPHGSPMRQDINQYAKGRLESVVRLLEVRPDNVHLHLTIGTAWQEIARISESLNIDLLVIGTIGRTGVSRLFLGNTAERVLQSSHSSVLTVKPDGFVSPIDPTFRVLHPS